MNLARLYRHSVAYGGLTCMGLTTSTLRYLSGGRAIGLNQQVVAPTFCKLMLKAVGVKLENNVREDWNKSNVCYFFNHNSFLDIFVIPLLGLKNTRFIISEGISNIIPLHLSNLGVDVLYIPDSHKTEERIAFFKRVASDLKEGKYSIICAPEGRHDWIHGIAPFNRGVFHMAQQAQVPIHNLFFDIPRDANPMHGPDMKPCTVKITSQEIIPTSNWIEEEIDAKKNEIHHKFLSYYFNHYGDYGDSII